MKGISKIALVVLIFGCGMVWCSSAGWAETPDHDLQATRTLVAQAPASPGRVGRPRPGDAQEADVGGVRINWSKLGLSNEQKSQLLRKRREFQIETAALREELQFVEQDLRAELTKEPADRSRLDELFETMAALRYRISDAAVQNLLEIKSLLTPEQLQLLANSQIAIPQELEALQLTSEQRKKVQQILKTFMEKNRQASGQLRQLRTELQELLLVAEDIDQTRLTEVQQAITEQEMAQEKSRVELFLQIRDILTPEQRARYQQLRTRPPTEGDTPPVQEPRRTR
jgi:Spy/CpxP family protein refolding chaperone